MSPLMGFGRILAFLGLAFLILGGMIYLVGKSGLNKLPGSISIEVFGGTLYIPVIGSIVLSIILTIILNIIIRFFYR